MPKRDIPEQQEIVRRVEGFFALADQLEARLAKARGQAAAKFDISSGLRPPSPRSRRSRKTLLARAWTHSLPARSGCVLSLPEILFAHSQRVQIAGQLVPPKPQQRSGEEVIETYPLQP